MKVRLWGGMLAIMSHIGNWGWAQEGPPGWARPGLSYPLAAIQAEADLTPRIMRGGVWLAGLPGMPRYNGTHCHAGLDLRAALGEMIYALDEGVVHPTSDVPHGGYGPGWTRGGVLIVEGRGIGGQKYLVVYGHTQQHRVRGGDRVVAGQPLAEVGPWLESEGGPHLHLTIRLGDLPRFGWGTPTLPGQTVKEGAEVAGSEEEVLRLGYRNPLRFLRGEVHRELRVGVDSEGRVNEAFVQKYQASLGSGFGGHNLPAVSPGSSPLGLPYEGGKTIFGRVQRRGEGLLQTLWREDDRQTGLLQRDGENEVRWVWGSIWEQYMAGGGPERLGYPRGEAQWVGNCYEQVFERGKLRAKW